MSELKAVVSVCMITYNHENYIKQAIEGVLMQQTSFPIELIIGEDCSTDNTRKICIEYQAKYPDIVRLILPEKNLGIKRNFIETMQAAKGNFIALCEGDDYWTDALKLQKQVDFLEANSEYSLCCHRYKIYDEVSKQWDVDYGDELFKSSKEGITFNNSLNLKTWLTKSMTLMFRRDRLDNDKLKQYKLTRDAHLNYELLKEGKGYCANWDAAVYRKHDGGIFSKTSDISKKRTEYIINRELSTINYYDIVLKENFRSISSYFFDTIRIRFMNKKYSKTLFNDLFLYLKDEYNQNGSKASLYCIKKVVLSIWKSFNVSK